jgi:hypothetical protein
LKQISSKIALLRSKLAQKSSFDKMHHYVHSAFLDLNSRFENIQQNYSQTVVNTDEVRKIVREEAFCLQETERRKTNIIVKNLPENKNVDDLSKVKQIIENELELPVPTIVKVTRLKNKNRSEANARSRGQPLLIQLPDSKLQLKRDIVQKSYEKRQRLQTFF